MMLAGVVALWLVFAALVCCFAALAAVCSVLQRWQVQAADDTAWNRAFLERQLAQMEAGQRLQRELADLEKARQQADATWRAVEQAHMQVCAKRYELMTSGGHDIGSVKH